MITHDAQGLNYCLQFSSTTTFLFYHGNNNPLSSHEGGVTAVAELLSAWEAAFVFAS